MSVTFFKCGRCGRSHFADKSFAYVGENDLPEFGDPRHKCGFVAIRCNNCGGEKAARRAVLRHLRRTERRTQ